MALASTSNLSDKALNLANESARWVTGNWFDIAVAVAIGAVVALGLLGLRIFACRIIGRWDASRWGYVIARVLSRTGLFFIVMCSAMLVSEQADTPAAIQRLIEILFVISAVIQGAVWGRELVIGIVEHRIGEEETQGRLGSAIGIIRLLVTIAFAAIALILILDNLGVNVTGLVAGLGIGGIAIGLAAQGIFSDLFAALSIIFDRPFRRGDGIQFEGVAGSVEQIGLKTTRVRSLSGEEVIVSNAKLLDMQIHNFSNLDHRRFVLGIGLIYQTPPEVCAAVPERLRKIVERHPNSQLVRCGMTGFGDSSLDFELQFDVHTTEYDVAFQTRSSICLEILREFNEAGIEFAYPTQTTFTAAPDGTMIMPYADVKMVATRD